MDKMEIRKCYYLLAEEFSSLSFEEALEHCHEKIKKILFLLSVFISYGYFAGKSFYAGRKSGKIGADTGRGKRAFQPCKNRSRGSESWKRGASDGSVLPADPETAGRDTGAVRRGCDNNKSGRTGAGFCLSASGKCFGSGTDFADRTYKEVVALCNVLSSYMNLCTGGAEEFEEICSRFLAVAQAFQLEKLHPGIMLPGYLMIAQGWAVRKEWEKTFEFLEKYTELATGDIYPLQLHGDSFFHKLDSWLEESLPLGVQPPRNVSLIRRSMTQALTDSPAFQEISEEFRFGKLVSRLKKNEEEQ